MTTARELAWSLRHEDPADVFLEMASEYLEMWSQAERRALYHAQRGDVLVAYDEASDAQYGLELGAVFVVAWLATIARRPIMRIDCANTDGEQLAIGGIGACLSMPPELAAAELRAADSWRGHPIARVNAETYVYTDTGAPVRDDPHRPCGACGRPDTPEGHDGCLGTLPDVINACCGHGDTDAAYIQRDDGTVVRGEEALSEVTAARPDQRSDAAEREESELRAISEAERADEESER